MSSLGLIGKVFGDLTGSVFEPTVVKIQNVPVAATLPTDGQTLVYNSSSGSYVPKLISGSGNGESYDQDLNTTNRVTFADVTSSFKGNLVGTASYTTNSLTASFATNSLTASYALNAGATFDQSLNTTDDVEFNTVTASYFVGDGSLLTNLAGASTGEYLLNDNIIFNSGSTSEIVSLPKEEESYSEEFGNFILGRNNYLSGSTYSNNTYGNIITGINNNIYSSQTQMNIINALSCFLSTSYAAYADQNYIGGQSLNWISYNGYLRNNIINSNNLSIENNEDDIEQNNFQLYYSQFSSSADSYIYMCYNSFAGDGLNLKYEIGDADGYGDGSNSISYNDINVYSTAITLSGSFDHNKINASSTALNVKGGHNNNIQINGGEINSSVGYHGFRNNNLSLHSSTLSASLDISSNNMVIDGCTIIANVISFNSFYGDSNNISCSGAINSDIRHNYVNGYDNQVSIKDGDYNSFYYSFINGDSNIITGSGNFNSSFIFGDSNYLTHPQNVTVFGNNLKSTNDKQFIIGEWNNTGSNYQFAIANGTDNETRSNVLEVSGSTVKVLGTLSASVYQGIPYDLSGEESGSIASGSNIYTYISPRSFTMVSLLQYTGSGAATIQVRKNGVSASFPTQVAREDLIEVYTTSAGSRCYYTIEGIL